MKFHLGPGLSGVLLSYIDLNGIFAIEFITCLCAVMATSSVVIPRPPKGSSQENEKSGIWSEVKVALSYISQRPALLCLLAFLALGHFCNGLTQVLFTPLIINFATPAILGIFLRIFSNFLKSV